MAHVVAGGERLETDDSHVDGSRLSVYAALRSPLSS